MLIIGARLIVSSARLVPCARLRISTKKPMTKMVLRME
jgi:hypothetical protein